MPYDMSTIDLLHSFFEHLDIEGVIAPKSKDEQDWDDVLIDGMIVEFLRERAKPAQ